jgi:hypothetical protein
MLAANENETAPELKLDADRAGERSAPPHGAVASSPAGLNAPPLVEMPTKRELIEDELRINSNRSDREIARIVGCDHKTVGTARERLGIAAPLGNSPTASPPNSPATDISLAGATDLAKTMMAAIINKPPAVPEWDPFEAGSEEMVIPHQPAIAVYENTAGSLVIRQACSAYDQEDPIILVRPEHVEKLIARLRYVAKQAQG